MTIATDQAQIAPNNSAHLGTSGDCGTATAVKQADGTYSFKLDHKAAYLCLLPRTPNKLVSTYVQQIKVMSDNNIAGTYTLTKAGLTGSGSSNAITLTTKTNTKGSAYFDGFPLDNSDTDQSRNAAYIVIAPGTHTLTIEYTLYDNITNVRGTFTKKISSATYSENTVYPITANINPTDYSSDVYYMWDAEIGQHYWKGYESDQPKIASANNGNYPKDNSDSRWYNQVMGYNPSFPAVSASRTCASCPNVNELLWYALKGDPHWDVSIWTTMGHLYAGGMWFLKKNKIVGFSSTIAPDGQDYRYHYERKENTNIPQTKPSNTADYFYLPAFGFYESGLLYFVGQNANYWSRSAYLIQDNRAYDLGFKHDVVAVNFNESYKGFSLFKGE